MRYALAVVLIVAASASGAAADDDAPRQRKMDLQERCAEQARKEFKAEGFDDVNQLDSFQSHYSNALERCLILIESTKVLSVHKYVEDAFEKRLLAEYDWFGRQDKKYWEVPPATCEFTPIGGVKTTCQSVEEFDAGVQTLMDQ